ncbi:MULTISPECIES: hypothetical protein [unclassified Amycolatopsis]|uniref:hypothetical protein n=1 Tax=unclassified Amycolatopsis TaxID=2618356 RepID=UPI001C69745B|nr:hypothetical protein [Amycolatopsis sp. DSM 110486]QYN19151.1 hypothetical protein K1T34_41920 [Amycolatopsis sp. DSM 110486]
MTTSLVRLFAVIRRCPGAARWRGASNGFLGTRLEHVREVGGSNDRCVNSIGQARFLSGGSTGTAARRAGSPATAPGVTAAIAPDLGERYLDIAYWSSCVEDPERHLRFLRVKPQR